MGLTGQTNLHIYIWFLNTFTLYTTGIQLAYKNLTILQTVIEQRKKTKIISYIDLQAALLKLFAL